MPNSIALVITLVLLLVWSPFCEGQTPVFKNYTTENGLPSSEVYFTLQDSQGYIWISTDRGVVRFDGYEFDLFTTDNGLPDNVPA